MVLKRQINVLYGELGIRVLDFCAVITALNFMKLILYPKDDVELYHEYIDNQSIH